MFVCVLSGDPCVCSPYRGCGVGIWPWDGLRLDPNNCLLQDASPHESHRRLPRATFYLSHRINFLRYKYPFV